MRTAIVGGGAAGFFLAVNLKEMMPEMEVCIFERSSKVLAKVKISGGGRCNCTNSFALVKDMSQVYPRGHRLMKRLFNVFSHEDAYQWFERHGVPLTTQEDECVFPKAQDSQVIIDCFLRECCCRGVEIQTGRAIQTLEELSAYDFVCITTGGSPHGKGLEWLRQYGHEIAEPVPSLFTFSINDRQLRELMGTVVPHAAVQLAATKFRADGPLLITHWGMSGPAILRLSSYAARYLHDAAYRAPLLVNWTGLPESQVRENLQLHAAQHSQKQLTTLAPFDLPQRLWHYLLGKVMENRTSCRWAEVGKKDMNRLINVLCNDSYQIEGRAAFKEEFVTCGGVALSSVNASTLESKFRPNLYFAGEILDIDGVTGGFNFQAAWTTAYTVAQAIAKKASVSCSCAPFRPS